MAETIGVASGVVALATSAFQASITLHSTIQSFQLHHKRVRDLIEELEALNGVLGPLNETLNTATGIDLSALDLPLLRCGNACKEFREELLKCSSRSDGIRTSFRDWAKLRYMGDDIDGFRRLLAGYKSTINIALTDATLRRSSVTAEKLASYKALIETATDDLQDHLGTIDEKLEAILQRSVSDSNPDSKELRLMKEERLSTQRCLQICDQLSEHINQIKIPPTRSSVSPGAIDARSIPEQAINEGLQNCRNSLIFTTAKLEKYMKDITDRMVARSKTGMMSEDDVADLARLQEEWETARQGVIFCSQAEDYLKENVSVIENDATGDAIQLMVSTTGKPVHGKNKGYGWRTRQVGGLFNADETVVQLSRDMARVNIDTAGNDSESSRSKPPSQPTRAAESDSTSEAWVRHGKGNTLKASSSPGGAAPGVGEQKGQNNSVKR